MAVFEKTEKIKVGSQVRYFANHWIQPRLAPIRFFDFVSRAGREEANRGDSNFFNWVQKRVFFAKITKIYITL